MAGALIMVFVFIMAQSLQLDPMAPNKVQLPAIQPANTPIATQQPTRSHPTITPTALPATATAPVSASQYVDNTNLTSGINTVTGQPLQSTQKFRLGQPVYVTMTIHQVAYNGAICLNWSVNNHTYPYASSASPGAATYVAQTSAYFYYKPGAIGPGFVDIYWASSTACADEVLVTHLPFTVTA
ncbi:hypothetical protein KDK_15570 [Dictyobacter kobayashii]|uniref:Chitin-binding type-4 domain-containing protein n=2 Tax=Dictyobacter kobayashii TaxID=2014872 RepID=A0A402AF53_9CHLR|nr:hypothetical protein KDK_15570 [Dictyobacter kobayashii]